MPEPLSLSTDAPAAARGLDDLLDRARELEAQALKRARGDASPLALSLRLARDRVETKQLKLRRLSESAYRSRAELGQARRRLASFIRRARRALEDDAPRGGPAAHDRAPTAFHHEFGVPHFDDPVDTPVDTFAGPAPPPPRDDESN